MIRRSMLLPLALAALAAGCSTFETDVVASVDDAELTQDEFEVLIHNEGSTADESDVTAPIADDRIPGEDARGVATNFVLVELLKADLAALGVPLPESSDDDAPPRTALENEFQLLAQTWTSLPTDQLVDDRVQALYEQGHEVSGLICASHILVPTEDEAEQVLAELDGGATFADVAAARSTDPGSAQNGGSLGCIPVEQFTASFIPEFVDAALGAEIGIPTEPVESEFGFHVIRLDPTEQLTSDAVVRLRVRTLDDRYEITVAPRIGRWDDAGAVVPVG